MKKIAQMCVITLIAASAILAANNPMVGGHEMFPSKNIVQNALNSDDHTTLVAAVKAAGLVDTLEGPGPFTVFAPTNEAFAKLPAGTVDTLLMTENKATLTKILTYHVVSGRMDAKDIAKAIKAGNGKAELTTVSGGKLWAEHEGKDIVLTDEKGGTAKVTISNVYPIERRDPRDRHCPSPQLIRNKIFAVRVHEIENQRVRTLHALCGGCGFSYTSNSVESMPSA